jgi:hypothetical protein
MSCRWIRSAVLVLGSLACAASAWAGDFWHGIAQDCQRRNCWPEPFTCPAKYAVHQPFAIMADNGWQLQNMLAEHHFEASTNKLNEGGRIRVGAILSEAPQHRRSIYVRRGANPQDTANRISAVQQFLAQSLYPGDSMPSVLETNRPSEGWPADRVDVVGRKAFAALPEPKLPSGGQGGGGGTGGGSK